MAIMSTSEMILSMYQASHAKVYDNAKSYKNRVLSIWRQFHDAILGKTY